MVLIKLTLVTITFNNFEELKKTIATVFEQNYGSHRVELVVINGGKCTLTLDYLKKLESPLENLTIKTISEPDKGIADAFNKGLNLASGEFIMYLNSGDLLIDKNYIEQAFLQLEQNKSFDFIHAQVIFMDSLVGPILMVPRMYNVGRGMPYYHQTMICKKSDIVKAGSFNTSFRITMDYDLVVRMHKLNMKGLYYPHPVVEMDGSGISATSEWISIQESKRSMINNGVFDFVHKCYFFKRVLFYFIRKTLLKLHLDSLLSILKRVSNSMRASRF